ncbi:MAG TPA: hypothetical protein VMI54_09955 [Polyangiaceae bacterium]|nr:hypothetical protein [Polyangiaceae bacterium]
MAAMNSSKLLSAVLLADLMLGCQRSGRTAAQSSPPEQSATRPTWSSPPTAVKPEQVATNWLKALGAGDIDELSNSTVFPFSFRTTDKTKECEGAIASESGLREFVPCLRKQRKSLMKELGYAESSKVDVVERMDAASSLRPLLSDLRADEVLVTGFINGDGVSFGFGVVLMRSSRGLRVRSFALDEDFEAE